MVQCSVLCAHRIHFSGAAFSLQALLSMTSPFSCRAREVTCHYGHFNHFCYLLTYLLTYFLSDYLKTLVLYNSIYFGLLGSMFTTCTGGIVFSYVCLWVCLFVSQCDNSWAVWDTIMKFYGSRTWSKTHMSSKMAAFRCTGRSRCVVWGPTPPLPMSRAVGDVTSLTFGPSNDV